jgi:hypothetical protein
MKSDFDCFGTQYLYSFIWGNCLKEDFHIVLLVCCSSSHFTGDGFPILRSTESVHLFPENTDTTNPPTEKKSRVSRPLYRNKKQVSQL